MDIDWVKPVSPYSYFGHISFGKWFIPRLCY